MIFCVTRNIDYESQKILEAIEYVHDGQPCAEDLEGAWCEKCIHLEPQAVAFIRSVPRWLVILAETFDRISILFKLAKTYIPWRGRNHAK